MKYKIDNADSVLIIQNLGSIGKGIGAIAIQDAINIAKNSNIQTLRAEATVNARTYWDSRPGWYIKPNSANVYLYDVGVLKSFPGHKGIPGHQGGSLPKGEAGSTAADKPTYERTSWTSKDVKTRKDEWEKMTVHERDRIAVARKSIKARIRKVTAFAGKAPDTGDLNADIDGRIEQLKDMVPETKLIGNVIHSYSSVLSKIDMPENVRYKLTMDALDTLAVQENEGLGRQLGDHGVHHINGNIDSALQMLEEHPGTDSFEDMAAVYVTAIYHDTGYLTAPSHDFLDEGHPRWSTQHYDANVRSLVAQALGDETAGEISHVIRTHDSTDMDWNNDFIGSAFRVADNTALFQEDKLPPLFRNVPGNTDILVKMTSKEISLDDAKSQMMDNVSKTSYSKQVKSELSRAVSEVNPMTGKFTSGMLGGKLQGFTWNKDHFVVNLKLDKQSTIYQKVLDLGQRQFVKFAEAYGADPAKFMNDLKFEFTGKTGKTLLESVIETTAVLKSFRTTIGWK